MKNYETCRRHHPEIGLIEVHPDGKTTVHVPKGASLKFRAAACLLLQNGKVDSVARKVVQDYLEHTDNYPEPKKLTYAQRAHAMRSTVMQFHNDQLCDCSKRIEELTECDGTIMTHQEYHHYVEEVRQRVRAAPFACSGVPESLFTMLDLVPDYGDAYQLRAQTIIPEQGGFVAYEYFDEDEDAFRIVCEGESTFPTYPGYELCRALLENDTLDEAMEALSDDNPARGMLVEILE